ncbi:MAG: hypothetical protein HZA10_05650 [Nitrospirae bacterium]|nr:hypothetical protein [Nitrospirota bacterium]
MIIKKLLVPALLLLLAGSVSRALAQTKCIDSEGEAVIVNNDVPSAKAEAVARAKWNAVEQVVGVEVKAQSVVQNFALVDDAVSKQIRGVVTGYKVIIEDNRKNTFWTKINACVEPSKARDALMSLALNNSIAVFIPARKPKVVSESSSKHESRLETIDEYDETNILSESLIGKLTEQGFQVVDVAPTHEIDAADVEKAMKSGNYMTLRSLMYKFLSNLIIIGKIDYSISTKKGADVGYGVSMPFNNVTVRLTYRIVTRDASGKMVILTAGAEEGKGLAMNVEDAAANGLKGLSEKISPLIMEKLSKHITGIAKKINVTVSGVNDVNTNFAVKDALQNTTWVTNVEEKNLGEFMVSYPENTVYLANSISQKPDFQILNFSQYSLKIMYKEAVK